MRGETLDKIGWGACYIMVGLVTICALVLLIWGLVRLVQWLQEVKERREDAWDKAWDVFGTGFWIAVAVLCCWLVGDLVTRRLGLR